MARPKRLRDRKNFTGPIRRSTTIRRGDMVQVIAGEDKGKVGKVLSVLVDEERVVVERVNFVKRHTKPRRQGQQAGILEKEAPIHVSNVLLFDPKADRGTRVTTARRPDGTFERVSKKSGETIGSA